MPDVEESRNAQGAIMAGEHAEESQDDVRQDHGRDEAALPAEEACGVNGAGHGAGCIPQADRSTATIILAGLYAHPHAHRPGRGWARLESG